MKAEKKIMKSEKQIHNETIEELLRDHNWIETEMIELSQAQIDAIELYGGCISTNVKPRFINRNAETFTYEHGPLMAYRMAYPAIVSPYACGFISNHKIVTTKKTVQSRNRGSGHTGYWFLNYNEEKAIYSPQIVTKVTKGIKNGIYVGGWGAFNYYHFFAEVLPRVYAAGLLPRSYDDYYFILPYECITVPQFTQLLSIFFEGRKMVFLKRDEVIYVENLIAIDDVNFMPINLYEGLKPDVTDPWYHKSCMQDFIEKARNAIPLVNDKKYPKLIFLNRPEFSSRERKGNQDELFQVAKKFGFVGVNPADYTLMEQANIFFNAEIAIGQSGAAWTNLIFASNHFLGLSFKQLFFENACPFSNLSHLTGCNIMFIPLHSDREIKSTIDAHSHKMYVPLDIYQEVLSSLVKSK